MSLITIHNLQNELGQAVRDAGLFNAQLIFYYPDVNSYGII